MLSNRIQPLLLASNGVVCVSLLSSFQSLDIWAFTVPPFLGNTVNIRGCLFHFVIRQPSRYDWSWINPVFCCFCFQKWRMSSQPPVVFSTAEPSLPTSKRVGTDFRLPVFKLELFFTANQRCPLEVLMSYKLSRCIQFQMVVEHYRHLLWATAHTHRIGISPPMAS